MSVLLTFSFVCPLLYIVYHMFWTSVLICMKYLTTVVFFKLDREHCLSEGKIRIIFIFIEIAPPVYESCTGLMVKTLIFHLAGQGSIPLGGFCNFFADFAIFPNFKVLLPLSARFSKVGT